MTQYVVARMARAPSPAVGAACAISGTLEIAARNVAAQLRSLQRWQLENAASNATRCVALGMEAAQLRVEDHANVTLDMATPRVPSVVYAL